MQKSYGLNLLENSLSYARRKPAVYVYDSAADRQSHVMRLKSRNRELRTDYPRKAMCQRQQFLKLEMVKRTVELTKIEFLMLIYT